MSNIPQISIFDTFDYCTPEFSYLQWFYTYSLNKGACPPFKSTPLLHKKQRGLTPLSCPFEFYRYHIYLEKTSSSLHTVSSSSELQFSPRANTALHKLNVISSPAASSLNTTLWAIFCRLASIRILASDTF